MKMNQTSISRIVLFLSIITITAGNFLFFDAAWAQNLNLLLSQATVESSQTAPSFTGDGGTATNTILSQPSLSNTVTNLQSPPFNYYFILGSHLQARSSTTTFAYNSNGCLSVTASSDSRLNFPVLLPDGSIIKYIQIYFNDTSASDMTVWLTSYQPGQSNTDLGVVKSSGSAGFGTATSAEITHTVENTNQYTINYGWGTTGTTNQICGVRISYYSPYRLGTFLPLINK